MAMTFGYNMVMGTPYQNSDDVEFGSLDYSQEIDRSYRYLPHWFQSGVAVFVTFRTADSLPAKVFQLWQGELSDWLKRQGLLSNQGPSGIDKLPTHQQKEYRRLRDRLWHRYLDDCHGACVLKQPFISRIVGDALLYFNKERYDLDSFIIMPNHVHVLLQVRPGFTLKRTNIQLATLHVSSDQSASQQTRRFLASRTFRSPCQKSRAVLISSAVHCR